MGLSFQDCSNPKSFMKDPRFGWGFFGHRYQLYTSAQPHEGYHILRRWAAARPQLSGASARVALATPPSAGGRSPPAPPGLLHPPCPSLGVYHHAIF